MSAIMSANSYNTQINIVYVIFITVNNNKYSDVYIYKCKICIYKIFYLLPLKHVLII